MSFTDQKPRVATEADLKTNWAGGKPGEYFRCHLCGKNFEIGDYWRWVYTNDTPGAGGNPMVCKDCDGTRDEVIEKWRQMHIEAYGKYWSFTRVR